MRTRSSPTYTRMIVRELLGTFGLAVLLSTAVLLFESIFRIMKMSQGIATSDILKLILYIQPTFLLLGIPMSLLVSILIVYGRMTMDNEITVLMACGTPFSIIARPAVRFASVCMVMTFAVSLYFFPVSNRMFQDTLHDALARNVKLDPGVITDRFPNLIIHAESRLDDWTYGNLFIYNTQDEAQPTVVTARQGHIYANPGKGTYQFRLEEGDLHVLTAEGGYTYLTFGRYFLDFGMTESDSTLGSEDMFIDELWQAGHAGPVEKRPKRLSAFHKRLTLPVACLFFGFIAPSLATVVGRSGRLGGFVLTLAIMGGYYALTVFGESIAMTGRVNPAAAMWTPNLILAVAAFTVYAWKTRSS